MHTVFIELEFGPVADDVYDAIKPELQASPPGRSRVELNREGGLLKLFVEAEDIVSLRAALNTWLRLIKIAEEMLSMQKSA